MDARMKAITGWACFAILSFAVAGSSWAGAQRYTHPRFKEFASEHKLIAILPFKVKIDTKRLKNVSLEMIQKDESDEGLMFQKQLYIRLLQKSEAEKYTIAFQDADQTNALLQRAGIDLDSLSFYPKDEIAKVLGVDAILSGNVNQSQPTSGGMALAQTLL
ncbi:MAG: hypothetical protein ACKO3S_09695, partial [bacterium]